MYCILSDKRVFNSKSTEIFTAVFQRVGDPDRLARQLARLAHGRERQVQVRVDPARMAARKMTFRELQAAQDWDGCIAMGREQAVVDVARHADPLAGRAQAHRTILYPHPAIWKWLINRDGTRHVCRCH